MKKRLSAAWASIVKPAARWLANQVGQRELVVIVGLALIAMGLREVSTAAAFAVPGAVLVWMAIPSRPPFFGKE